jgi:hypothetical protein
MTTFIDPGYGDMVVVDGNIVDRKMLYLVEKIKDYDPNIEVVCLDPDMADNPFEEPFLICERVGDQVYKIFGCWELNDSVLERLHLADKNKVDILASIDAKNAAVRRENQRRYEEKREEIKDLVAHVAANPKSSYSFKKDDGTKVTLYEDRPAKRE